MSDAGRAIFIATFASSVLFTMACADTTNAASSSGDVDDHAKITECLTRYNEAAKSGDFVRMATCHVAPMSDLTRGMGGIFNANRFLAEAMEEVWKVELAEQIAFLKTATDRATKLPGYEFSNIRITDDTAVVATTTTVRGEEQQGELFLVRDDGNWYVTQQSGDPRYSHSERIRIRKLAKVARDHAAAITEIARQIRSGQLEKDQALGLLQKKTIAYQAAVEKARVE